MIITRKALPRRTFIRGLGITLGLPMLDAMDITSRTAGNAVVEKAIMQVRRAVEAGRNVVLVELTGVAA